MGKGLPDIHDWKPGVARLALAMLLVALVGGSSAPARAHAGEKHEGTKAEAPVLEESQAFEPEVEAAGCAELRPDAEAHDHAYPPVGVPRPLAWLGKFHPPLTHFPIAVLAMAAVAEILLLQRPRELFRHSVRFCVWGGAIGAILAAPLGWFFAGLRLVDDEWLMTAHRWTGTATALWAIGLLYSVERLESVGGEARTSFRAVLFGGAGLAGAAGFLGGALIYGLDHYSW